MASSSRNNTGNPRTLSANRRSNSSPELQIHGMDSNSSSERQDFVRESNSRNNDTVTGACSSSADCMNNAVPQRCLEHLRALHVPRSDGYIGPELNDKHDQVENEKSQASSSQESIEKENENPKAQKTEKRRQSGFSRVASVIVSKFTSSKERPKKLEKQESKDNDCECSDTDSPGLQRGRSKSLSGRILRRFRDQSRERNSDESSTPKRRQSHRDSKSERTRNKSRKRFTPFINFAEFDPQMYPTECEEDIQRAIREKEIQEGVDPPPGFQSQYSDDETVITPSPPDTCCHCPKSRLKSPQATIPLPKDPNVAPYPQLSAVVPEEMKEELLKPSCPRPGAAATAATSSPIEATYMTPQAHTQVDYMHCLVPDQQTIMNSCFYWGKIDRYEADEILENKPEGTFLLRDSSQEEFLFSVSFRRYGRTLHARIEQWNHKFSFDAHDPSVFSWHTICGLLEHYKDPNYCMFFEPMLTIPLPRTNPPTLQELARSVICSNTSYDGVHYLELPRVLKDYLKEYHYKQRVRVRQINNHPPEAAVAATKSSSPKFVYKNVSKTCISR